MVIEEFARSYADHKETKLKYRLSLEPTTKVVLSLFLCAILILLISIFFRPLYINLFSSIISMSNALYIIYILNEETDDHSKYIKEGKNIYYDNQEYIEGLIYTLDSQLHVVKEEFREISKNYITIYNENRDVFSEKDKKKMSEYIVRLDNLRFLSDSEFLSAMIVDSTTTQKHHGLIFEPGIERDLIRIYTFFATHDLVNINDLLRIGAYLIESGKLSKEIREKMSEEN